MANRGRQGLSDLHHQAGVSRNTGGSGMGRVGERGGWDDSVQSYTENLLLLSISSLVLQIGGGGGCLPTPLYALNATGIEFTLITFSCRSNNNVLTFKVRLVVGVLF